MKAGKKARFVGIDLGKRTYQVAFVGRDQKVTMSNGRTFTAGRQALYKKLRREDIVALEAGNLAFIIAKEIIAAVGCRVYVLNPSKLAVIYASMKKTDKEDSLKLAHVLEDTREERLPEVPLPSDKEMNRRKMISSYYRAQQSRNRFINQLHALFVSRGITTKVKADLATSDFRRKAIEELGGIERDEAVCLCAYLEICESRIRALEKQMAEEAAGDTEIERLQSVPGVGPKVSFTFASHVAPERFENASQVSNYLGLVPRVYMSGDTVRYGKITKRGMGYARALLVQAAWALVRSKNGGKLKELYHYMTVEKSISKKKAIVAIARRLAELLYTLMKEKTVYEARQFIRCKDTRAEKLAQEALCA